MQILNPLALLYLPLIAAVLLLMRRQVLRERRPVSALFLWQAADARDPIAAARFKMRRRWLLLVQAALLMALALALGRPTIVVSRSRAAFLIDISASMGARHEGGTRLELARREAERTARALPAGTQVSVWTAGTTAANVTAVSTPDVGGVVSRLTRTDGSADIAASLATIRTAEGPATPIFVFTDQPAPDAGDAHVGWTVVGTTASNFAITSLAGRQLNDPAATEIVVGIRNFSAVDVDAPFEIRQGTSPIARGAARVPAHETMTAALQVAPLHGVISGHLLKPDALEADDIRFALLPSEWPKQALLISGGNFFLEQALASVPSLTVETVKPGDRWARDGYDVIVCDGCDTPPGNDPALLLPHAPAVAPSIEPFRIASAGHRLARFIEASDASVSPLPGPAIGTDADVIARAGRVPVVVASEAVGRRVVELRMDLRESPMTLSTTFPILISNAVAWLTREGDNATALVAGEPLNWTVGPVPSVNVEGPDGDQIDASLNGNRLSIASTEHAGAYGVRLGDRREQFVVNPATDTESDLTVRPASKVITPTQAPATQRPVPLTTALLAAALLLLGVEFVLSRPLSRGAQIFRAVMAIAIAAAATAPRIPLGEARQDVLFLLDRSASMTAGAETRALGAINTLARTMRAGDQAGLIVFGTDAVMERPLDSDLRVSTITSRTAAAGTNIEAALRLAGDALTGASAPRAVLLSDGRETVGDGQREAARLAAEGVAVDVVPLNIEPDAGGLVLNGLSAPALVRTGEPFAVAADIRGLAGARAEIEFKRDGISVATQPIVVGGDGTATAEFTDAHQAAGIHTFTAAMHVDDAPDGLPGAGVVVTVDGPPSMLYVSDGPGSLIRLFESAQWDVQKASLASLPNVTAALARYDAVVLEDAPADRLSPAQSSALSDYVQNAGGGLLLLGGTSTIGSFQASPLNRLLPVDVRPHSGARGPGMALVLAFDKSGSMSDVVGGVSKIELARQAVLGALQAIPPADLFGAIAFDSRRVAIAPLAAGHDIAAVARDLRALDAGGATAIAPAVDLAETWLIASGVSKRRVLLVSDGRTAPADIDRLREAVRARQFELSVVAIGDDADRELMTGLAAESGGRAYFPSDVSELPKIVARDAAAASTGRVVSGPFVARVLRHAATRAIDQSLPPTLTGYAVSAARPGADVILASHLDDPLLAGWRIGLGRVAVFTSDLQSTSAGAFTSWPAFPQFWSQTARWLGRHASADGARLALESTPQGVHVRVTFEPPDSDHRIVEATASLRGPSGPPKALPLKVVAPGRFEATARLADEGAYAASVAIRRADGRDEQIVQGIYWSAVAERPAPMNRPALEAIAATTGGRVLIGRDSPFMGPRPDAPMNVGPFLTNLALVALLIEIARRRGLLSRFGRRPRSRRNAVPQQAAA